MNQLSKQNIENESISLEDIDISEPEMDKAELEFSKFGVVAANERVRLERKVPGLPHSTHRLVI